MAKKPEPADMLDEEIAAELAAAESTTTPVEESPQPADAPATAAVQAPPPAAPAMPFSPEQMMAIAAMMAQAMQPVLHQLLPGAPARPRPLGHYNETPAETAQRIAEEEAAAVPLPDTRVAVTVHLQARHHAWLAGYAARLGRTLDGALDLLVRQAWQVDPQRLVDTRPTEKNMPAGSGPRAK